MEYPLISSQDIFGSGGDSVKMRSKSAGNNSNNNNNRHSMHAGAHPPPPIFHHHAAHPSEAVYSAPFIHHTRPQDHQVFRL